MAQTFDPTVETNQDPSALDALAPSTHPPIIVPEGSFLGDPPVLGFAPAPISEDCLPLARVPPAAVPADLPAPLTRQKGQFRVDWYEAAIIALGLGCAVLCLYRLLWAFQI